MAEDLDKTDGRKSSKDRAIPALPEGWHRHLGDLIEAIGGAGFGPALVAALRQVADFDYSVTFAYRGEDRPICLNAAFPPPQHKIHVTDYQTGPYLLDPFCKACLNGVASGLYRLRDLAPDRFYQSEYYRSYYVETGPVDEIAFFAVLEDGTGLVTSLMRRREVPVFSPREFRLLAAVEPVVRAVMRRHWQGDERLRAGTGAVVTALPQVVQAAVQSFDSPSLTQRESEVISLVLQGHSSESIGRQLGISTGTVRIHRKNVYTKLRISSQQELFAIFLKSVLN